MEDFRELIAAIPDDEYPTTKVEVEIAPKYVAYLKQIAKLPEFAGLTLEQIVERVTLNYAKQKKADALRRGYVWKQS